MNLLKEKLNKVIWVVELRKNNIKDAIIEFEKYILLLKNLLKDTTDESETLQLQNEINNSYHTYTDLLLSVGNKNYNDKNFDDASLCYMELLKYKKDDLKVLMPFVICLDELQLYDLEVELMDSIHKISTINLYDFYYKISEKYIKQGKLKEAIQYRRKGMLGCKDLTVHDYNNLGDLYNQYYSVNTSDVRAALKSLAYFKKASNMAPSLRVFAKNATIMAGKTNQYDKYKFFWDRMLKINDMNNDDKFDYACYCLKTKNIQGWYLYSDARFQKENNKTKFPCLNKPYWNGKTDISNSTLLIHCEQGFGDSILFSGYIQRLQKYTTNLIMVVQDELVSLFQRSFPYTDIRYKTKTNVNDIVYDYYVPMMSIPKVLNLGISSLSVGSGYLIPDSAKTEYFRNKFFNTNKFKIGISCSGSNTGNKTRDIPVETFLMLDEIDNIELYSLTKGLSYNAFSDFKNHNVCNLADEFKDFDDTAAAMMNCDLIITSDNVILNLAGALGVKTFGLYNWSYEFRWFDLTGDNVIYYDKVKPFVNTKMNDWASSMLSVVKEIKETFV